MTDALLKVLGFSSSKRKRRHKAKSTKRKKSSRIDKIIERLKEKGVNKRTLEKVKKALKEGKPVVIKAVKYQIGRSKTSIDKERKAMKPGKRISKSGKIYYEYRKNRSDLRGGV